MTTDAARSIYNPVQPNRVTFLKTAHETGREVTLVEVELAPGGGNGLLARLGRRRSLGAALLARYAPHATAWA